MVALDEAAGMCCAACFSAWGPGVRKERVLATGGVGAARGVVGGRAGGGQTDQTGEAVHVLATGAAGALYGGIPGGVGGAVPGERAGTAAGAAGQAGAGDDHPSVHRGV